jgi:hypothetical protein
MAPPSSAQTSGARGNPVQVTSEEFPARLAEFEAFAAALLRDLE